MESVTNNNTYEDISHEFDNIAALLEVLNKNRDSILHVSIKNVDLCQSDIQNLVAALPQKLEILSLHKCGIDDKKLKTLNECIEENEVKITNALLLNDNKISDAGAKDLASHLPDGIRSLHVNDNNLSNEGFKVLAKTLMNSSHVKPCINLYQDEDSVHKVMHEVLQQKSDKTLDLKGLDINTEVINTLGELIINSNYESINLQESKGITQGLARSLIQVIAESKTPSLDLQHTELSGKASRILIEAAKEAAKGYEGFNLKLSEEKLPLRSQGLFAEYTTEWGASLAGEAATEGDIHTD